MGEGACPHPTSYFRPFPCALPLFPCAASVEAVVGSVDAAPLSAAGAVGWELGVDWPADFAGLSCFGARDDPALPREAELVFAVGGLECV